MLAELKKNLKDMIIAQQVFYVLKDLQPASRIIVDEENLGMVVDYIRKLKLKVEVSDFKVTKKAAYQYACERIKRISKEKGSIYVYISKSPDIAKNARNLDWSENHEELGLLQGYPECCITTFNTIQDQCYSVDFPFINSIINNSKGSIFSYFMNIMKKHRGISLLIHMPCSFDCERSLRLARNYHKAITEDSPEYGEFLTNQMRCGVIFNNQSGVIVFNKYAVKNGKYTYEDFDPMYKNEFTKMLENSKKFESPNKGTVAFENKMFNHHFFLEFI